jgi:sulfur-oxidizing protein SoxY
MPEQPLTRRAVLTGAAFALLPLPWAQAASDDDLKAEMARILGGRTPTQGRVSVTLPELAENGNSTPITVAVESPMTATEHVRYIDIFSEKNPVKHICRISLGPRAGRAKIATNIRLADGQQIIAAATMNDGTVWAGAASIVVTTPACIDDSVN